MKQVLMRRGQVVVEEMPVPCCGDGEVLVRACYSLISSGTETVALEDSVPSRGASAWGHRLRKVGEVARMVLERGLGDTRSAVAARHRHTPDAAPQASRLRSAAPRCIVGAETLSEPSGPNGDSPKADGR